MVESPSGVLFEPVAADEPAINLDSVKKGTNTVEPELLMVKQQPITATIRTALRHLRSRAGFWSLFRGFSLYMVYGLLVTQTTAVLSTIPFMPRAIAAILSSVAFARLRMGWTHIVISDPSPKPWFRRLPSIKLWKKIALPTALLAFCEQITIGIPVGFFYAMKLDQLDRNVLDNMTCAQHRWLVVKILAVCALALFTAVAIVIPASVTLTRVQASLLDDTEETIVPFDRSFGGKVVPEIVGGSGTIGMLDAWKSFDMSSRLRLLKLYFKVGMLQLFTSIIFSLVIAAELFMVLGKDGMNKTAALASVAMANKNQIKI